MNRVSLRLILIGLVATASMLLAPLERLMPVELDPFLLRLLAIVQPAILVVGAGLLGGWAAPKVGLDAPLVRAWVDRRSILTVWRNQASAATAVGLGVGLILAGFWAVVVHAGLSGPLMKFQIPLATKILYGGIVEELLMRWGPMSLVVWAVWRLGGSAAAVPIWCYWAGIGVAAILFAVGHLPALYLLIPDPHPWFVALVIIANAVPGILFGWLFWRRGLEAAMLAHALAHLVAATILAIS